MLQGAGGRVAADQEESLQGQTEEAAAAVGQAAAAGPGEKVPRQAARRKAQECPEERVKAGLLLGAGGLAHTTGRHVGGLPPRLQLPTDAERCEVRPAQHAGGAEGELRGQSEDQPGEAQQSLLPPRPPGGSGPVAEQPVQRGQLAQPRALQQEHIKVEVINISFHMNIFHRNV